MLKINNVGQIMSSFVQPVNVCKFIPRVFVSICTPENGESPRYFAGWTTRGPDHAFITVLLEQNDIEHSIEHAATQGCRCFFAQPPSFPYLSSINGLPWKLEEEQQTELSMESVVKQAWFEQTFCSQLNPGPLAPD